MRKVEEINLEISSLKQLLHECKILKQTLTDATAIKNNNKKIEALNIQIKDLKNELRLVQSIERDFASLYL